ncbi:MAG: hypothetical protein ACRDLK_08935 [Gaiellaceae bacterium]
MGKSARTDTEIRHDLETERARLAEAVGQLRAELTAAADIRARLDGKLPAAAAAAASAGFVVAGGSGATIRYLTHRGRG